VARDVQYVDFTHSTEDGFVVDSPALPRIAVGKTADAINVLLVPARPTPTASPGSSPQRLTLPACTLVFDTNWVRPFG
jgi:hypothetical protein